MSRKYHNRKLQTNPWHREKEPHNDHETPGRQTKQSNQLSLPHQYDCKTVMAPYFYNKLIWEPIAFLPWYSQVTIHVNGRQTVDVNILNWFLGYLT